MFQVRAFRREVSRQGDMPCGLMPPPILKEPRRPTTGILPGGETVLAEGSRTDRLLILRRGDVAVLKRASRSPGCRSLVRCSAKSQRC